MHTNGLSHKPAWTPAPFRFPQQPNALGHNMGQGTGLLESPTLAMILDLYTGVMAGYMGWGFGRRGNNWSTFWYVVSAVAGVKFLHDLGRIKK